MDLSPRLAPPIKYINAGLIYQIQGRGYKLLEIIANFESCISFLTFNSFNLGKLKLKMKTMRKVTLRQGNKTSLFFF